MFRGRERPVGENWHIDGRYVKVARCWKFLWRQATGPATPSPFCSAQRAKRSLHTASGTVAPYCRV